MSKWIKFEKSAWNLAGHAILFDKIVFYMGRTDHWGIGFDVNFYDRSITFEILNLYAGVELWHPAAQEFVPKSNGDMFD